MTEHADAVAVETNGGASKRFPELSDFRRDILLTLARAGATHGAGLVDDLSALRDEEIHDGRLYPNLNALVDADLVEKRENEHDERSHEFVLSERGRHSVREHAQRVTGAVESLDRGGR
jgi:DNA-binding PadR family transcriptional regulator